MDKQEAKKILKEVHDTSALFSVRTALETVFPELKESEDERIRKAVIEMIHDTPNIECEENYNVRKENVIAWLEKQGTSYTKRDVDDAFVEGMAFAKDELEKQCEKKPIEWKDSDEKYLFWALLSIQKDIAASEINGVNTKDLNDCVKWLYSLKQRMGG